MITVRDPAALLRLRDEGRDAGRPGGPAGGSGQSDLEGQSLLQKLLLLAAGAVAQGRVGADAGHRRLPALAASEAVAQRLTAQQVVVFRPPAAQSARGAGRRGVEVSRG